MSIEDMDIPGWRLHPLKGDHAGLISRLINEKTDVSPAMALKLSVVLGRSPESWLLMQDNYDLWKARKEIDLNNYNTIEFAV